MPADQARARRAFALPGQAGFTLIELLVVLAVMGFAIGMAAGFKPPWSSTLSLKDTGTRIAAALRLARSEAVASNRPVVFSLDLTGHRYSIGGGPAQPLPSAVALELTTIAQEASTGDIGHIRFNPDGSSTGGRILLANARRRILVGVEWLTGRITMVETQ